MVFRKVEESYLSRRKGTRVSNVVSPIQFLIRGICTVILRDLKGRGDISSEEYTEDGEEMLEKLSM